MSLNMQYLLLLATCMVLVSADLASDIVTIPGYPDGYQKYYQTYSGYLDVKDGMMHYIFIEKNKTQG